MRLSSKRYIALILIIIALITILINLKNDNKFCFIDDKSQYSKNCTGKFIHTQSIVLKYEAESNECHNYCADKGNCFFTLKKKNEIRPGVKVYREFEYSICDIYGEKYD